MNFENVTKEEVSAAMELVPTLWIEKHQIKNENGNPISFTNHPFLYDIYNDLSPLQAILKAPQVGMTTLNIIKSFYVAQKKHKDIIYTLPTATDINDMAGGKVNRIIAQNPILKEWVKEHDTVDQKTVGDNLIYYRGTFTAKQAMMVASQLNIHDEVDASDQRVIEQYETRLQATVGGWRWYFSHPSAPGTGVDIYWNQSDEKHWFIKCEACNKRQFISWPQSIDERTGQYVCKACGKAISDDARRNGEWVKRWKDKPFSGYWIPQLICPWIPASKIIDDHKTKTEEYFTNFTLGLPYVGGGNKLTKQALFQNLTDELNDQKSRIVIGVDTGKNLHYVAGNDKGLFLYDVSRDYDDLYRLMRRFPRAIAVVDGNGDLIGSRQFRQDFPGRVFLAAYGTDKKGLKLARWGKKDEDGSVIIDVNRIITLVVEEFTDKRVPLQGTENDWYDYYLHWSVMTKVKETDETGRISKETWIRSGDNHWASATGFWRVGMMRFSGGAYIVKNDEDTEKIPESFEINSDGTYSTNLNARLYRKEPEDWRDY